MTKLKFFLTGMLAILALTFACDYLHNDPVDWDWRRDAVTEKFGQMPEGQPTLDPVVHLFTENKSKSCTAFIIDKHYAITAGHCLKENGDLNKGKFKFFNEAGEDLNVEATAKGFFTESDFGLLFGDFSNFRPMPTEFYRNGFTVKKLFAACGFPYAQNRLSCNAFIPVNNKGFLIRGSGFLLPGMSGGPVIDLDTQAAVGVIAAVDDNGYVYVTPLQGFLGAFRLD